MFIENIGQFGSEARFQVRGGNGTIWLAEDGIWVTVLEELSPSELSLPIEGEEGSWRYSPAGGGSVDESLSPRGVNLKISFPGANPSPRIEPFNPLDATISYFIGDDPGQWQAGVPVWGGVRYVELYPGIDLEISGVNGHLVQHLVVREGADLNVIQLRVEGADEMTLEGSALRLGTAVGDYFLPLLQLNNDTRTTLPSPSVAGNEVTTPFINLPDEEDSVQPLSGAADLLYSTFLGGSNWDSASDIVSETGGKTYVTGTTYSTNFPTMPGPYDQDYIGGSYDAFVVEMNTVGSAFLFATFLGGSGGDSGTGIVRDGSGFLYITGETASSNFPTTSGALYTSYNGNLDAFVVKLSANGRTLSYATFLGGSSADSGIDIALASGGLAFVTGYTDSDNFPTTAGALDRTLNDYSRDAFVVKLNAAGSALSYGTFLGGAVEDIGYGIAVDSSGAAYVTGKTCSPDFPTAPSFPNEPFDWTYNSHSGIYYYCSDGFVTKLNAAGSALVYSAFLGGNSFDYGTGIAVGSDGSAYVAGATDSDDFPATPGAYATSLNSYWDAFVVKVNATASALTYATFLGGSGGDHGDGIAINASGEAFVTGFTDSDDFPTTVGAFDRTSHEYYDAFAARLNAAGSALSYGTYLAGGNDDFGDGIALDGGGSVHVVGTTRSSNFPTTVGALDITHNGDGDAFVAMLVMGGTSQPRTVLVQDDTSTPVSGAQVFRNGALVGTTGGDGTLYLADLVVGDELVARKRVTTFGGLKGSHDGWQERVYITSLDVLRGSDLTPWVVTNPFIAQTLTLRKSNTLIGFNIVVSVEWDANADYLEELRRGILSASDYLFDASDGQMLFEQVAIYDNNQNMGDADYQFLASNQQWPETTSPPGGIWRGTTVHAFLGRYFDGESSNLGSWKVPRGYRTLIHEFGHYGLSLYDSYFYYDYDNYSHKLVKKDGHCTSADIRTNHEWNSNATLMDYENNSSEFSMQDAWDVWSDECKDTYQWQKNGQSDWETIVEKYQDTNSPARWEIQTPSDHGGVVIGPNPPPVGSWKTAVIGSNASTGTCEPPKAYLATYGGKPAVGATVMLKRGSRTIDQGKTDDKGVITVLGAVDGDKQVVTFNPGKSDQLVETFTASCDTSSLSQAAAVEPGVIVLEPAAFGLEISTAPGTSANDMDILVMASTALVAAPETLVTQNGSSGVPVTLSYDAGLLAYTGTISLDSTLPPSGTILVTATDLSGNVVDMTAQFAIEPVLSAQATTVRSVDGQAELYLPPGSLSGDGRVSIAYGQNPGTVPAGQALLGGPYTIQGNDGLSLIDTVNLSLFYLDNGGTLGHVDLSTVKMYQWNGASWQALTGTPSQNEHSVSAVITSFGTYALMAEPVFAISGNTGAAGVTLTYSIGGIPQTVVSDIIGNYTITVPYGWSGTVVPSISPKQCGYGPNNLTRCYILPIRRIYNNTSEDQSNQNYTLKRVY
jgi:hypothetical protein